MEAIASQPRLAIRNVRILAVIVTAIALLCGVAVGYVVGIATTPTHTVYRTLPATTSSAASSSALNQAQGAMGLQGTAPHTRLSAGELGSGQQPEATSTSAPNQTQGATGSQGTAPHALSRGLATEGSTVPFLPKHSLAG